MMNLPNQKGVIHTLPLLLVVAAVGIISYLLISSTVPFGGGLFNALFPKPTSHAAGPGVVFLNSTNQVITQTTTPNIKVELDAPWSVADAGFKLVKDVYAQSGSATLTAQVNSSSDDVNQDGSNLSTNGTVWTGTGSSTSSSYTGLRFTGISIPKGAVITSAKLQVYSTQSQWISNNFSIAAENTGNSQIFSSSSTPSQRSLTGSSVSHSDNVSWSANTSYTLDEMKSVIQEVVNRSDWQSGNSLSVILKGTGGSFARKNIASFDSSAGNAPKLVITYTTSGSPTSVPTPTVRPSTPSSPTPPPATSVTLNPVADTFISSDCVTCTNLGTTNSMYTDATTTHVRSAFIRYDLNSVAGRTITGAVLRIHTTSDSWAGSAGTQTVQYLNNNNWTENSMTWNNTVSASDILSTPIGTFSGATQINTNYDIPLSASNIQSHLGGLYSITMSTVNRDNLTFGSRESANPPQLILTFSGSGATPVPTPAPKVASAVVAEDAGFTQNVKTVSPFTSNPTVINYTLSATLGTKTVYVRYTSNTGLTQTYQGTINLVSPTPVPTPTTTPMGSMGGVPGESMSMQQWQAGAKNVPNPLYDKCDDGTDVSLAHKQYYVVAYDGIKYPTWHPAVVTNPITGVGKCYFGHEHGSDPQKYMHWDEIYQHFGKDLNGDGKITPMVINSATGVITPGDRAGIPFGIANEHMDMYYNSGPNPVDSIFVRHEDHVGHKIEFVNKESDINTSIDGNVTASTHQMAQLPGTNGLNVPYYVNGSENFQPTGVVCTHLHKFHQGTHSGDAIRNNLHEVIFHSECDSVNVNNINAPALYPNNTVLLTGMMSFGNPGEYVRFCFSDRSTKVCPDGAGANGKCNITDPLLSKMPNAINSSSLGRNMVDKYCLQNFTKLNPGNNFFAPYELWEGDLAIYKGNSLSDSSMIAEHGRQWDVLDPIRYVDPASSTGFGYNSLQCAPGGLFDGIQYIGGCSSRTTNVAWDSPQSGFRGLKRTTYFGRNRIQNSGGSNIYWTDPLGGNATPTAFGAGLKQKISTVNANIQAVQSKAQQLFGPNTFLNDRAIQRAFNDGGHTVHAPN